VFLAAVVLAGLLGGCGKPEKPGETTAAPGTTTRRASVSKDLKLPCAKNDTLNPYKAASALNRQIAMLLYDGLFHIDAAFKPVPVAAKGYNLGNLSITVQIKPGLKFTDGTALTSEDVVASFNKAKSSPAYAARLANLKSAAASGNDGVVFTLHKKDPYAVNCLDFAITPSDDKNAVPAGSGRYILEEENGIKILTPNGNRLGRYVSKINKILLVEAADSKTLSHLLQIGGISFLFSDLRDGSYSRISASAMDVPMNSMVFLAFNSKKPALKDPAVRRAAGKAIDRESVAAMAFQGHARAAYSPFNPDWMAEKQTKTVPDAKQAASILEKAGYTAKDAEGTRRMPRGPKLELSLLVNKGNGFKTQAARSIAAQLKEAGIKVNVRQLSEEDFNKEVKAGKFDMYLGQTVFSPNMNLSPILAPGGAVSYGIDTANSPAGKAYADFIEGRIDLTGFIKAFNDDSPFLSLCYLNGVAAFDRSLTVTKSAFSDVYCDIGNWYF